MKFTVSGGDLEKRMSTANRAIASKNSINALDNCLFSVEGDKLYITGSDAEVTIVTTVDLANVEGNGRIAIPGAKLLDFLKKLPEQPVDFNINLDSFAIQTTTAGGDNSQVGYDALDYPLPKPLADDAIEFNITSDILLAGINNTIFATGSDDMRPAMMGIFIDIMPDAITFVGTDTHILARYTRRDVAPNIQSSFILGKKAAGLLRTIVVPGEVINVKYDTKNAVFTAPNYSLTCRLVDGAYPAYRSIIPNGNPYHAVVSRSELLNNVDLVSIFQDGTELAKFDISNNSIKVSAQDLDFSCSSFRTMPCHYEGEELTIGMRSSFLVNILKNVDSTDLELSFSDPSRPCIILPVEQPDNTDALYLIMPMRI